MVGGGLEHRPADGGGPGEGDHGDVGVADAGAAPATGPVPVTTLTTPCGMPASVAASANSRQVSGVSSAGLSTMVLPAAMAGRIFQAAICSG